MLATALSKRSLIALAAVAAMALAAMPVRADDDSWAAIHENVFDNRPISEEDGTVTLEAPYRAEDAAVVPLTMHIPASAGAVKSLTLVIEENPAPIAATFHFGDAAGKGARTLSTRVRINTYSNVRAVVETADGKLHMATKFVKASGGCSAPAGKDMDAALANLGKMKIKTFDKPGAQTPGMREAQVMIHHPNYTGMQMNQLTREFTPAKFVQELEVKRGGELIFRMDGGISISENPNFRFTYAPGSNDTIEVTAKDTDGNVFTATSSGKAS